jgi:hypothetical protein
MTDVYQNVVKCIPWNKEGSLAQSPHFVPSTSGPFGPSSGSQAERAIWRCSTSLSIASSVAVT